MGSPCYGLPQKINVTSLENVVNLRFVTATRGKCADVCLGFRVILEKIMETENIQVDVRENQITFLAKKTHLWI